VQNRSYGEERVHKRTVKEARAWLRTPMLCEEEVPQNSLRNAKGLSTAKVLPVYTKNWMEIRARERPSPKGKEQDGVAVQDGECA